MQLTTIDNLIKKDFSGKNVVIVGKPTAGKTRLSRLLKEKHPGHTVIHTDDYTGNNEMNKLQSKIASVKNDLIIEGNLAYKLLQNNYKPDVIIFLDIDEETLELNYHLQNKEHKLYSVRQFARSDEQILKRYMQRNADSVIFYEVNNPLFMPDVSAFEK